MKNTILIALAILLSFAALPGQSLLPIDPSTVGVSAQQFPTPINWSTPSAATNCDGCLMQWQLSWVLPDGTTGDSGGTWLAKDETFYPDDPIDLGGGNTFENGGPHTPIGNENPNSNGECVLVSESCVTEEVCSGVIDLLFGDGQGSMPWQITRLGTSAYDDATQTKIWEMGAAPPIIYYAGVTHVHIPYAGITGDLMQMQWSCGMTIITQVKIEVWDLDVGEFGGFANMGVYTISMRCTQCTKS
jgi:hypothetical protein